ncbi:hypothetical protein OHD16_10540 [Sphingobacterium sp. ML3W]|uniref:hypothetical protein n=1 Tax=Sphingobacterium sp. ML3W TaxID=1538644 RepID=UPI00249A364D|nr:hypothetical protein [Sphingobacterium sp. ML3W]WFA80398.1 hypothetical protein OGI71_03685 [Sphingobacterium sp. ML3W]
MTFDDVFRQYWAFGLNNITINNSVTFNEWIKSKNDYQINSQVLKDEFIISCYNRQAFLQPLSKDCNRFATACLESIIKIDDLQILPKNISWLLIKQYYSAYYAAHLILRFLGYSLSQFDSESIKSIKQVADLFSNLNGISIESGYYLIDFGKNSFDINCKKIDVKKDGGSHVALWKLFGEKIRNISVDILTKVSNPEVQPLTNQLDKLLQNLSYVGSSDYSWLSRIRNDLNYKHIHGAWHPYDTTISCSSDILKNLQSWKNDPLTIELSNLIGKELLRFSNTCMFIISLAHTICQDMTKRCGNGKSFLNIGYSKIYNINVSGL